mgnify:CR=1 FL=1
MADCFEPPALNSRIWKAAFFIKKGLGVTYLKGLAEGVRMCDKKYKVHTEKADWRQYLRIQWELWVNVIRRFSDMGEEG